jgi:WhiB family redox-sensing transcriptional regulator
MARPRKPKPKYDNRTFLSLAPCRTADPKLFDAMTVQTAQEALDYCRACELGNDCSHYVKPSTTYFDGVCAGAVWENGKRIAQLIKKKKPSNS